MIFLETNMTAKVILPKKFACSGKVLHISHGIIANQRSCSIFTEEMNKYGCLEQIHILKSIFQCPGLGLILKNML